MSHHYRHRPPLAVIAALLFAAATSLVAQNPSPPSPPPTDATPAPASPAATPATAGSNEEIIGPLQMRGETLDAVLVQLGRLTGRSILRPQALPATEGYTLALPPMPKSETILALETLLTLNGIAVSPLGDKFLKVIPVGQARTEAPEMIQGSTLDLPPSGRVATKLFQLDFLRVGELKDLITPLLNPNLGGPVLFEKTNAVLITDALSTLQRIEQLIHQLDQPVTAGLKPKFYPLHFAKASELVNKISAILKPPLSNQISSATSVSADDRTNQIILVSDPRQYLFFDELIAKLDVKADPNTRNEVISLKHATAKDVATLLTNLVSGRSQAASRMSRDPCPRPSSRSSRICWPRPATPPISAASSPSWPTTVATPSSSPAPSTTSA